MESRTKCASSSRVVVELEAVTELICGLIYWEISWRRGNCGSLEGDAGVSGSELFNCVDVSRLRGAGEGDVCRVLLRVRSRSAGSL